MAADSPAAKEEIVIRSLSNTPVGRQLLTDDPPGLAALRRQPLFCDFVQRMINAYVRLERHSENVPLLYERLPHLSAEERARVHRLRITCERIALQTWALMRADLED